MAPPRPPPGEQKLWNPGIETLPAEALRELQWRRLGPQLRYDFERSPFYRKKFEAAGLTPGDVRSWEDFQRLPLMDKDQHREAQAQGLAEFGDPLALLGCARRDEIVRINATSGTTGMPTLYALTGHDVAVVNEMHARKYWRSGIRPGDVMIQALSLSMFTGGLPLSQGIMHLGAACVPVGIEGGTARVLEFVRLTKPEALIATPSFGQHLIEECAKRTGEPAPALGIARFFCAGEPGGGEPAVRTALSEGFGGAKIFDHTGGGHAFHGISRDEPPGQFSGMYFVSGDHCIFELIDPSSKAPVDLADGARGEMVWTFLDWRGGPFLRYAMGDIAEVFPSPCPSGTPGMRFRIIGRADDMLIIRGVNVYPAAIGNEIVGFQPGVTGAFRIVLREAGPKVAPPLRLKVEHGRDVGQGELAALAEKLRAHLRQTLRITVAIEWLPPGTLPRQSHKTRLIEMAE